MLFTIWFYKYYEMFGRKVKKLVIRGLNSIIPKNKKKVLFASFPDFGDNSRALYEYMMQQEKFNDWTFVWEVSSDYYAPKRSRTVFIKTPKRQWSKYYLIYLYHVFTSYYLFCTHSSFVEANPLRQVSVCLWHGTMLKCICAMNEREKNNGNAHKDQYRYFVSPSRYYVDYFCKSFLCEPTNVINCGYPRNDMLFDETQVLEKLNINRKKDDKLVVYMPTFRTPVGGGYSDMGAVNPSCVDFENNLELGELSEFLKSHHLLLVVKWHPADIRQNITFHYSNIVSVSNQSLSEVDMQAYHLLHFADALITDYSSVFCDYMLLDRPMAFDTSDMGSYSEKRGFVFDNPLDYMPGYILHNKTGLISFLEDISQGIDKSIETRHSLYHIYNDFQDDLSSKRVVDMVIAN